MNTKSETIRETIKYCLNETEEKIIPITIPYMFRSFALLLYIDASARAKKDPDNDIMAVLANENTFNPDNMGQLLQLHKFLKWWFKQPRNAFNDEDTDNGAFDFCDELSVIKAWNKYIAVLKDEVGARDK